MNDEQLTKNTVRKLFNEIIEINRDANKERM